MFVANLIGFGFGLNSGFAWGYKRADAEITARYDTRRDEHDKIMRKVGLCTWARIMSEDIKCKSEPLQK